MFSPRSNFATVILDDMIFVIGGYNGNLPTLKIELFWSFITLLIYYIFVTSKEMCVCVFSYNVLSAVTEDTVRQK